MTSGRSGKHPEVELTLSAGPSLLHEDARSAAVIERELVAIEAEPTIDRIDRLIDYVWDWRRELASARLS